MILYITTLIFWLLLFPFQFYIYFQFSSCVLYCMDIQYEYVQNLLTTIYFHYFFIYYGLTVYVWFISFLTMNLFFLLIFANQFVKNLYLPLHLRMVFILTLFKMWVKKTNFLFRKIDFIVSLLYFGQTVWASAQLPAEPRAKTSRVWWRRKKMRRTRRLKSPVWLSARRNPEESRPEEERKLAAVQRPILPWRIISPTPAILPSLPPNRTNSKYTGTSFTRLP